jgi:hypothetical protein
MSIRAGTYALAVLLMIAPGCDADGSGSERAGAAEEAEPLPQGERLDSSFSAQVPPGGTFEEAELGHSLFAPCTVCHGPDAAGTQLGPSLVDDDWIHVEPRIEQVAALIRDGVERPSSYPVPMPPHGGGDFDEAELRALAVYTLTVANRGGSR